MQVVICADVHLDSISKVCQHNERETFLRVIRKVQETEASLLLIAGDLVDGKRVTAETVQFLKQAFEMIPDTYVFISPGNNDPATRTSIYLKEDWPENVFIFTGHLEAVELALPETGEKIRVYGMNYRPEAAAAQMFAPENFPALDPAYINILLMHGEPDPEQLNSCGFDFCALGHRHSFSGVVTLAHTVYAYPGACEGRGFNQAGGILAGTLSKGTQALSFVDVASVHYREVTLDISNLQSQEEIVQSILQHFTDTQDPYRLTLTGTPAPQAHFSITRLKEDLKKHYDVMQVRAQFSRDAENVRPLLSGELSDYLVKEAEYQGSTHEDPELLRLALEYALSVCPGSQQTPEEVYTREEFSGHED